MKILVIEDDESKLERLREFIATEFDGIPCESYGSFRSGLEGVLRGGWDLVILDMALPTYDTPSTDDDEFRVFAGKEILRQMDRRGVRIPVIVVTQFESFGHGAQRQSLGELRKDLAERFTGSYRGLVYYNAALDSWKEELRALLSDVLVRSGDVRA